jgi:hypothetical protein
MAKVSLGNREVVWSGTLLVPDSEVGIIETTLGLWPLRIEIRFMPNEGSSPELSWQGSAGVGPLQMTFKGWKNPLGAAVKVPQLLGTTSDGRKFGFMASVYRVGDVSKIDFQLLWGGEYG